MISIALKNVIICVELLRRSYTVSLILHFRDVELFVLTSRSLTIRLMSNRDYTDRSCSLLVENLRMSRPILFFFVRPTFALLLGRFFFLSM